MYWDRPARVKQPKPEPGRIGRAPNFPQVEILRVGETVLIPWFLLEDNLTKDYERNASIIRAVNYHGRKYQKKFFTFGKGAGLEVTRTE